MKRLDPLVLILLTISLLILAELLGGCGSPDERLADYAANSTERQAAQNEEMSRLNREIATGSKRLVEGSAQSTDKLLTAQHDLDQQRSQIDAQRQLLADERNRESLLGPVISTLGLLLVCSLPLVLCWYLLRGLTSNSDDGIMADVLLDELTSQTGPLSIPQLPAIPNPSQPRIETFETDSTQH